MRKWQLTYRAVGRDGLLSMGKAHARYDFETKVAAASAVVDGGMGKPEAMGLFGIASLSSLKEWCRLYREGGAGGAQAKAQGQAQGFGGGPDDPRAGARARGQAARGAGGVPKKIDGPEGVFDSLLIAQKSRAAFHS